MKRLYFIFSAAALAFSALSCTNEIEDLFPQTATQRLSQVEQECLDLLLSSEQGWLIQYYPSSSREYGGFTFCARFDENGNVTMTSELAADPAATATSHYSINTATSVTLTFDTYNTYFHALSDPDIYGTNAFGGDFEFAFESGDESRIVFRAIKTGNRIVFTALDTDIVSAIRQVLEMKNQYFVSYTLDDGTVIDCDPDGYNIISFLSDPEDPYSLTEIPFAYSLTGITLYDPFTYNGVTGQTLTWDPETMSYVSDGTGTPIVFHGQRHPDYMPYEDYAGTYTLTYGGGSVQIELVPSGDGSTYTMEGFFGYSPTVTWTPSGYLTLMTQYLGTYGRYYAWLCPWDSGSGYLTWSMSVGFNLVNEGNDPDAISFTFVDNGVWGTHVANGILIYAFTSQTPSSSSVAGYIEQIVPVSFVKNN